MDGWLWPAGRGAEPYSWEPPRTIPARSDPQRSAKVRAIGNAVVPQCAALAGARLQELVNA